MRDRIAAWRASSVLEKAQKTVSSFSPHPNYDAEYRPQESSYWSYLPRWIWTDQRPAQRCLDVGAGYGSLMVFCHLATGATVHGLDFDPVYATDGLKAMPGLEWAQSNIELDPIPWPGLYDFVVFSEVIEHLNFRAEPTLVKLAAALVPGGRIYLSTPDAAEWGRTTQYYDSYDDLPLPDESKRDQLVDDHVWQFSKDELWAVVGNSGLEVVREALAPGVGRRHFNLTLQAT